MTPDGRRTRLGITSPSTTSLVADPSTGGVLAVDFFSARVVRFNPGGRELWRRTGLGRPTVALRTPLVWWVGDASGGAVVLLDDDGTVATSDSSFAFPVDLAPGPEGSVWVADRAGTVSRLLPGIGVVAADSLPVPVALSPLPDGGVWVAVSGTGELVRLAADASEVERIGSLPGLVDLEPDPILPDGVWAADRSRRRLVLLAPGGAEVLSHGGFPAPSSFCVTPGGEELWVADVGVGAVVRISREGTVLTRSEGVGSAVSISIAFDPGP
jgi:DNA-binding beta-propeller fold protein YncE